MTEPRYQDLRGEALPVRREAGVEIRVMSSRSGEIVSPTLNHVAVTALDARIDLGASFRQEFEPGASVFILVLQGDARIGAPGTLVGAGKLAWLTSVDEAERSDVAIAAERSATRLLLFAARPLREPVAMGGPFVMNTEAEIQQAFFDYRAGRF